MNGKENIKGFYDFQREMLENSRQEAIKRGNYEVADQIKMAQDENEREESRATYVGEADKCCCQNSKNRDKGIKDCVAPKPFNPIEIEKKRSYLFDRIDERLTLFTVEMLGINPHYFTSIVCIQHPSVCNEAFLEVEFIDTTILNGLPISAKLEEQDKPFTLKKKVLSKKGENDEKYCEIYTGCEIREISYPKYKYGEDGLPIATVLIEYKNKSYHIPNA